MANYLTYTPTGADTKRWDLDDIKLMSPEVIALEKQTGSTIGELGELIERGSFMALHAFTWVFLRREVTGLRYEDFVCDISEIGIESDDEDEDESPKD
ncbi:MAG: hypothetical protein NTX33_04800 [Propionibacteriales bacterium]|nr:hypothetical protein [Propionibacteriales bacterium]